MEIRIEDVFKFFAAFLTFIVSVFGLIRSLINSYKGWSYSRDAEMYFKTLAQIKKIRYEEASSCSIRLGLESLQDLYFCEFIRTTINALITRRKCASCRLMAFMLAMLSVILSYICYRCLSMPEMTTRRIR